jgi:transposase
VPAAADDSLASQVRRRIRYLEELQTKYDELDEEFEEEMRALEKKYRALYGEFTRHLLWCQNSLEGSQLPRV